MTISTKYNICELVFLKHDPEQLQRMVTAIIIRQPHGRGIIYELSSGSETSEHSEYELSADCDHGFKMNNEKQES